MTPDKWRAWYTWDGDTLADTDCSEREMRVPKFPVVLRPTGKKRPAHKADLFKVALLPQVIALEPDLLISRSTMRRLMSDDISIAEVTTRTIGNITVVDSKRTYSTQRHTAGFAWEEACAGRHRNDMYQATLHMVGDTRVVVTCEVDAVSGERAVEIKLGAPRPRQTFIQCFLAGITEVFVGYREERPPVRIKGKRIVTVASGSWITPYTDGMSDIYRLFESVVRKLTD